MKMKSLKITLFLYSYILLFHFNLFFMFFLSFYWQMMNEILYGVRVVKFYAWESYFHGKINHLRDEELNSLKIRKYLDAACAYFWATTPVLIAFLTFITYTMLGNQLTAGKVSHLLYIYCIIIIILIFIILFWHSLCLSKLDLKRKMLPEIYEDEYVLASWLILMLSIFFS